jgi:hypothetical protein
MKVSSTAESPTKTSVETEVEVEVEVTTEEIDSLERFFKKIFPSHPKTKRPMDMFDCSLLIVSIIYRNVMEYGYLYDERKDEENQIQNVFSILVGRTHYLYPT